LAVDRRVGFPFLFASFTGESKIVYFKVAPNTCQLSYVSSTLAVGVGGRPPEAIAVSPAGPRVVVAAYADGSVQSFKIMGGTPVPQALFNSTGFINQGGQPTGVDITKNSKYA
jgi:6-phosphogluconolactonase (cycloisomerase 2 family)